MSRRPAARRRDAETEVVLPLGVVRVDRWLVAARCFKTRPNAQEACGGGHVKVNGRTADAGHSLKVGDELEFRRGEVRRVLRVRLLAERRGSPEQARLLFEDLTPRPPPVAPVVQAERGRGEGRPTKRDARELRRLKVWQPE